MIVKYNIVKLLGILSDHRTHPLKNRRAARYYQKRGNSFLRQTARRKRD